MDTTLVQNVNRVNGSRTLKARNPGEASPDDLGVTGSVYMNVDILEGRATSNLNATAPRTRLNASTIIANRKTRIKVHPIKHRETTDRQSRVL